MKRILVATIVFMLLACGSAFAANFGDVVYTKVNIHVDRGGDTKASYAIYTESPSHGLIPINTKVEIGKWRSGFSMTVVETGEKIFYEYAQKRMKWSLPQYLDLITSPDKTILKLPALDMKNVEEGTVVPGMTKDGVIASLGYPASHKTPNLEDKKWTFWRNRFTTRVITFDGKGIVTDVNPPF